MSTAGERIKEERQRLGLTQADFGDRAAVSKRTQVNYEQGKRSPDAEYLLGLAMAGADVLYIVTGERKPAAPDAFNDGLAWQILVVMEEALLAKRKRLTPNKKGELFRLLYEHSKAAGKVERSTVERFLRLMA